MLSSNNTSQIITVPTRATNSSSTIIDHILTNDCIHPLTPSVIRTALSDHYPTFCIIIKCSVAKNHIPIYRRRMTKFNPSIYCNDIYLNLNELSKNFTEITPQNFNLIFEEFIISITNTIDSQAPLKALSRKNIN